MHRLRQAANDTYYKTLIFKLLESQPEPVEGGFFITQRLRQAQPDSLKKPNFESFEKNLKNLLFVPQADITIVRRFDYRIFKRLSTLNKNNLTIHQYNNL